MAIVVEYHEHQPVSHIIAGCDKPVWRCKYVYLDGTRCPDMNAAPGYPTGWSGSHTMTRDAIDTRQQQQLAYVNVGATSTD
jgi:hypothetical protein